MMKSSTNLAWLSQGESAAFFGEASGHAPVPLKRLKNASVLWVNEHAATQDPHFAACKGDRTRYEKHLLDSCAFEVDDCPNAGQVIGHADRYGGPGIGSNGGSGRAVVVNGYHVKGVGRTPLVSQLADPAHASGGAYLEETVREIIFGEIARLEFPCSAVPALALIDTGRQQTWQEAKGVKIERRTLLVRPAFVRPAHFERATGFFSAQPHSGWRDANRVEHAFRSASAMLTPAGLYAHYQAFWKNWTRQLAYAFVHRLPHSSNTISNICFDGKLLDFGAMSAVPSWANIATMLSDLPFTAQFKLIRRARLASHYFFARYVPGVPAHLPDIAGELEALQRLYTDVVAYEVLRVCGVTGSRAGQLLTAHGRLLHEAVFTIVDYFQKERIDLVNDIRDPRLAWDVPSVWLAKPPRHLRQLAGILNSLPRREKETARQNGLLRSATRTTLYREQVRKRLFEEIDQTASGASPDREKIAQAIDREVVQGRRDSRHEPKDAVLIGFARNAAHSYALYRDSKGEHVAVCEHAHALDRAANIPVALHRLRGFTHTSLLFDDNAVPPFAGQVSWLSDDQLVARESAAGSR